jgi:hydroxymethylpyrimidine/phosphomethylpyrimidine kinase
VTPRVLVLGGIDPCGGAGVTADARTIAALGAEALPIVLALTVQNRHGCTRVEAVAPDLWLAAMAAALADGRCDAIKVGLLADAAQAVLLAERLRPLAGRVPLVVDPVLSASAGGYDAGDALVSAYADLLPLAPVLTPNLPELARLGGEPPDRAVARLRAAGCLAVLIKGGHGEGTQLVDELHAEGAVQRFVHPRLDVGPVHGTGCALASVLAAELARGAALTSAAERAVGFLQACLAGMGPPDGRGLPRPLRLPEARRGNA